MINGQTGYTSDLWTTSVTAFTALVFVVNVNIMLRFHFITVAHVMTVLLGSIALYLAYMWAGNFFDYSQTQFAVEEAHVSPVFYLSVACTIGLSLVFDFLVEAWQVIIVRSPTDFLRQMIS